MNKNLIQFSNTNLGHNSLKLQKSWHNYLSNCFIGTRNKTIVFNFQFTLKYLIKALYVFTSIIKCNGDVLIVNTNPELSKLSYHVKKNINSSNIFFSDCGWTKGTLTNWGEVFNKVKTFMEFHHDFDDFLTENNIHFPNYKKMKRNYKGFINTKKYKKIDSRHSHTIVSPLKNDFKLHSQWKPDLLVLMNIENSECIIKEAYKLNIPVIAFVDSSSDISNITYPIPTNIYCYSFVWLFFTHVTKITKKYSN